ncbi:MAG: DUF6691 family protein [Alphaproteobacteria bacterium]
MKLPISTFIAGLIFGAGLTVSQMVNPNKVISFLDVMGNWDPSLAFVMGGALLVTFIGYKYVLKKSGPLFDDRFRLPTRNDIDTPLIFGAAMFGVGWGIAGLCPGPALASLSFAGQNGLIFVTAMVITIVAYRVIKVKL